MPTWSGTISIAHAIKAYYNLLWPNLNIVVIRIIHGFLIDLGFYLNFSRLHLREIKVTLRSFWLWIQRLSQRIRLTCHLLDVWLEMKCFWEINDCMLIHWRVNGSEGCLRTNSRSVILICAVLYGWFTPCRLANYCTFHIY